jgi:hypothetical protein
MAFCGECKEVCEIRICHDSDGEEPHIRRYEWVESKCCDADAFADEELTDKLTAADVDYPEPVGD